MVDLHLGKVQPPARTTRGQLRLEKRLLPTTDLECVVRTDAWQLLQRDVIHACENANNLVSHGSNLCAEARKPLGLPCSHCSSFDAG